MTTKIGVLALLAALGVTAAACTSGPGARKDVISPEPTGAVVEGQAVEVATGFLEAYGTFDAERAIGYLADDANVSDLSGTVEDLPELISWLEVTRYEQLLGPCEELITTDSGTSVRCAFDFHLFGSDEIGLGPYSGSSFDVTVDDGRIIVAALSWDTTEFSPQMWEPFADWISTTYPEDGAVMFNESYTLYRLSEASIRLWERHVGEYVNAQR
jgi:hypothetical protein